MKLDTIIVEKNDPVVTITFNQQGHNNSITRQFLDEMTMMFNIIEKQNDCNVVILKGTNRFFCTGMDFNELISSEKCESADILFANKYKDLLKQIMEVPKIVISEVEGKAIAGGVGFVAASDIVIADYKATFSLSEALWGLLPSIVIPFLIRRIGFHKAYYMTLTTMAINAEEAFKIDLIDKLTDNIEIEEQQLVERISKLTTDSIKRIKEYYSYFFEMSDSILERATKLSSSLFENDEVRANINNYIKYKRFPWDK